MHSIGIMTCRGSFFSFLVLLLLPLGCRSHQSSVLDEEQIRSFERDGFLFVKGLLANAHLTQRLVEAAEKLWNEGKRDKYPTFSLLETNMLYAAAERSSAIPFKDVALHSKIPQACAELLRLDPKEQNLKILRDVFLGKTIEAKTDCGWHVDDYMFWPESYISPSQGINVWIALDEMPSEYRGSMAVARGSHKASWRHNAYRAIGQDRTTDANLSKEDYLNAFAEAFNGTCDLEKTDPDLHNEVEQSIVEFDMKPGDIIFLSRQTFHKTLPVTSKGKEFFSKKGKHVLNRYSIRYVTGDSRLPSGYTLELSMVANDENRGRSLDEVAALDDPAWYPEVWPVSDKNMEANLEALVRTKLPRAREKLIEGEASFREFFRNLQSRDNRDEL